MSYILEALKKAQAERQLGSAPTIHALPIHAAPAAGSAARRAPLIIGAAVLALAGVGALFFWPDPAPPVVVTAAPPPAPPPIVVAAAVPPPVPAPAPAPAPAPVIKPKPRPATPAPAPAPMPTPTPTPAPAPEENLPLLRGLPEAIQREVPEIAIGGYIYSRNPADSLLLIDKVLRREGDEIKPGLTLEKLQSKGAIMNYKGYRYRVPY